MDTKSTEFWRQCSSCKKPIAYSATYYVCSVSTCNGQRTGYVFCSVSCFERHLPGARHKDAAAIEKQAPPSAEAREPVRRIVGLATAPSNKKELPREVLIIASRLKEYISAKADFNTSADVMEILSEYVRHLCNQAIDQARSEGRKTVLERDFDFLKEK